MLVLSIRTRVIASAAIAVAATVACAAMLWIGASRSIAADAEQEKVQTTSRAIASLLLLTQEYALHREPRAAEQWAQEHAVLTRALTAAVQSGDGSSARAAMRSAAAELPALFAHLRGLAAQPPSPLDERQRELVVDQLLSRTQGLADSAYRWSREAALAEQNARRGLRIGGGLALLLLLAAALAQPIVVWRRVLRPLAALERAAAAIERGDLAVRCASDAQDELGRASRRFDAMTAALAERSAALQRSEQRLRAIADSMPALITQIDASERYTFVNAHIQRQLGIEPAALIGKTLREFCGEPLYAQLAGPIHLALKGQPVEFETQLPVAGALRHFQSSYIPDRGDDGVLRGFYGISFDVTERKQGELRQAAAEQRLRTIADNLPVLIATIDAEQRFRFCNATYERWFGVPVASVEGRPLAEVIGVAAYAQRKPFIERALAGERIEHEYEIELPSAGKRQLHALYIPHQEGGRTIGLYALVSDVTERKRAEEQLQQMARFDSLTGLPNRRQFDERLPEAQARAQRSGTAMALLFLDLDHFKNINDSFGHAAGDDVLKQFARRLKETVRATDTVARLGGDEFVIIVEGLRAAGEAAQVAAKVVAAMRGACVVAGQALNVTTSVGVAVCDGRTAPAALMAQADAALYAAKQAGRNGWRLHDAAAARTPTLVRA